MVDLDGPAFRRRSARRPAASRRAARRIALGTLLLALAGCGSDAPRPRRLVLLTLDTLRWDSFAGAAGRPSDMPRTLAWAARGLVFERFYAASNVTQPSHAAMLTGLAPWQLGVHANGQVLAGDFETVPERLAAAGWQTAAVVASFPVAGRFGFAQGFATYQEIFDRPYGGRRWEGHELPAEGFYADAETVTDAGLALLDRLDAPRQFLWLHYFDPHDPYGDSTDRPGPPILRLLRRAAAGEPVAEDLARARAGYAADAGFLDAQLDRLLRRLAADAATWDTWVVAASDHGESLGEGGSMGHGKRLSEEQLRVPLFIVAFGRAADRLPSERRTDPAGSVDVAATLLALAGAGPAAGGRDLTASPAAPSTPTAGMRRSFGPGRFEERLDGSRHSLDEEQFFVVDPAGRLLCGNQAALAEPLPADLGPGDREAVRRLFASFTAAIAAGPQATGALDPETERALKALGYLD